MSRALADVLAERLAASGRVPWAEAPRPATRARPGWAQIEGRERLLLCTNDYLGLASDPRIVEAARAALSTYGFGSRAARSLAGDTEIHHELERELADFKGVDAALLFTSGFATNVSVVPAITSTGDVVYSDELNHASIVDGCRLSGASIEVYRHGDVSDLERLLSRDSGSGIRLIVTDAVFSMDGDIAPMPGLVDVARRYDAVLMLDEAHATGVLGATGKGALEHFGLSGEVPVLMGTLGKALGAVGGFVAGSTDLIDHLAARARGFLFTTSLPPAAAAVALRSLRILRAEPELVARLWSNARALHAGLSDSGYRLGPLESPIIPVFFESDAAAGALAGRLFEEGIVAAPVGPPYVAAGTSRLRVIASAAHDQADLGFAIQSFARCT
jgi:glycine C-acetyltransferase